MGSGRRACMESIVFYCSLALSGKWKPNRGKPLLHSCVPQHGHDMGGESMHVDAQESSMRRCAGAARQQGPRAGQGRATASVLSTNALMPKSAILASPLRLIRMLAGFMSRCTCGASSGVSAPLLESLAKEGLEWLARPAVHGNELELPQQAWFTPCRHTCAQAATVFDQQMLRHAREEPQNAQARQLRRGTAAKASGWPAGQGGMPCACSGAGTTAPAAPAP